MDHILNTMLTIDSENNESVVSNNGQPGSDGMLGSPTGEGPYDRTSALNSQHHMLDIKASDNFSSAQQDAYKGTYSQVIMKPKFVRAPIKEAGRVAYLGESSNLSLLVHDRHGSTDVVHYPLPETMRGAKSRLNDLDTVDIDILHTRGAFLLPPRGLCDELVDAFFTWVAPVVPVISRARFMRRYKDSKNPPSLLLLQAILLAGSRVCKNPQLMDSNGSTTPAAMTFYKRAKALFDANYEEDRVTIVQAAVLMGWYWEGPEGAYFKKPNLTLLLIFFQMSHEMSFSGVASQSPWLKASACIEGSQREVLPCGRPMLTSDM